MDKSRLRYGRRWSDDNNFGDIDRAKCISDGCTYEDKCFRKTASKAFLQPFVDYLAYEYTQSEDDPCAWFVNEKPKMSSV